jgi:hypothetical protein
VVIAALQRSAKRDSLMSLFEDDRYRWRETYFVLFHTGNRPSATAIQEALRSLAPRIQLREMRVGSQDELESMTMVSPDDFAAMDISYVSGEEVEEQIREWIENLAWEQLTKEERQKWELIKSCNARFDIYHFEQVVIDEIDDDDESYMDPGALLIVLQRLAELCRGTGLDPQSGTAL